VPLGFGHHTVASHTRFIVNDGNSSPDNPVEQSRLANVWTSYYGDQSWHGFMMVSCGFALAKPLPKCLGL